MRIQLLGINYAPERTGIAPYTTGLARHLSQRHEVTVITGLPHYPDWVVKPEHRRWRHEERDGDVRVVRVSHHVPRTPSAAGRAAYELSWSARAAAVGVGIPTDLVIAVVPALFGAKAAQIVARRHRAPLGLFVQDIMGTAAAQSGYRGGHAVSRVTSRLEASVLRSADSVTTIHPRLADELQRISGGTVEPNVIYNWTHVTNRPKGAAALRASLGWDAHEVIALHSGNMGSKQNLEVLVDAARLAALEGRPVRFVLAGGGSQRLRLAARAEGCPQIDFLDSVDDAMYMDLLAAADVLLINERPGMSEMSLPSKLTSYLVAGRPIVAATDPHSATAEFVRASGGGIVIDPGHPGLLLDTVAKIATDPQMSDRLAKDGHTFAEKHLSVVGAMADYDAWIEVLAATRTSHR